MTAASWLISDAETKQNGVAPFGPARASQPMDQLMAIGPSQTATVFDGSNYIIVTANWR